MLLSFNSSEVTSLLRIQQYLGLQYINENLKSEIKFHD